MIQNFTSEQLVAYLYKELPKAEALELEEALLHDSDLASEYAQLLESQNILSKIRYEAPDSLIDRILEADNLEMA